MKKKECKCKKENGYCSFDNGKRADGKRDICFRHIFNECVPKFLWCDEHKEHGKKAHGGKQ